MGGETQIGWVLLSHRILENETLLLVRDSYVNQLFTLDGQLSIEEAVQAISYPIDISKLTELNYGKTEIINFDEKIVNFSFLMKILNNYLFFE